MGSMCFRGFTVSRPSIIAVGSPSARATHQCATSWIVMAKSTGSTQMAMRWARLSSSIAAPTYGVSKGAGSPLPRRTTSGTSPCRSTTVVGS